MCDNAACEGAAHRGRIFKLVLSYLQTEFLRGRRERREGVGKGGPLATGSGCAGQQQLWDEEPCAVTPLQQRLWGRLPGAG